MFHDLHDFQYIVAASDFDVSGACGQHRVYVIAMSKVRSDTGVDDETRVQ